MMASNNANSSTSWRFFLVEQAAWLVLSIVGGWAALVYREMALELFIYFQISHWSLSFWDKIATLVIFILWLTGSAWLQYALSRLGSIRKVLRVSVAILTSLLVALGTAALVQFVIT